MKGGWDPKVTEELFYEVDGIFKGPVGLPELVGKLPGPRLPIDLRPDLDVYANIRPCRLRPGAPADGKKRLTCACKWGMCKGDDLFKETFTEVAEGYPDVETDYAWVDAWSYWAIMRPDFYDVAVMPNQYGDILSDMSGAIQGSMGLAGALNAGDNHCYAEPTHSPAPDIAGRGIDRAVDAVLSEGKVGPRTSGAQTARRSSGERWQRPSETRFRPGTQCPSEGSGSSSCYGRRPSQRATPRSVSPPPQGGLRRPRDGRPRARP